MYHSAVCRYSILAHKDITNAPVPKFSCFVRHNTEQPTGSGRGSCSLQTVQTAESNAYQTIRDNVDISSTNTVCDPRSMHQGAPCHLDGTGVWYGQAHGCYYGKSSIESHGPISVMAQDIYLLDTARQRWTKYVHTMAGSGVASSLFLAPDITLRP